MNRRHWLLPIMPLIMLAVSAPASAVEPGGPVTTESPNPLIDEIETGDRIAILIDEQRYLQEPHDPTSRHQRVGRLESIRAGVLVMSIEDSGESLISVPLERVRTLRVDRGKPNHALEGALIGFVVGVGIAIATQGGPSDCEGFMCEMDEMPTRIGLGIAISAFGTAVGAAIGSSVGAENWQQIYDRDAVATAHGGQPGGYAVTFGFGF